MWQIWRVSWQNDARYKNLTSFKQTLKTYIKKVAMKKLGMKISNEKTGGILYRGNRQTYMDQYEDIPSK